MDVTPSTMQAVVCHGPEDYRLEEVPVPEPGPGEALVRVEACGICASDLKCFHGAAKFWGDESRPAWAETQVIPGHEFVGTVEALDDEAAERWGIAAGDRVVSEQIVPCRECRYCLRGQYHMCAPHSIYGFKRANPGGMASYMVYDRKAIVHKVSGEIAPHHAAFVEPLSCSLHAVERATIGFEDVVVVAGCGPIGLGMVAGAAAKSPAQVVALDLEPAKLELAKACGADVAIHIGEQDAVGEVLAMTEGYGADVYIEGTGHPSAVAQGLAMLRKLGTFVEYSVFRDDVTVDWSIISDDKELDVRGAHLGPYCYPIAIDLFSRGLVTSRGIVTHGFPLADWERAFQLANSLDSIKVLLKPGAA
jgi:erythritol/L-threitol dehydrogenase